MKPQQPWTCADHEKNVFAYFSAQLEPSLRMRAQAHVQGCLTCQEQTRRWSQWKNAIVQDVATLSSNHSQTLAARISEAVDAQRPAQVVPMRRRMPLAGYWSAAAAIVAIFVGMLWQRANHAAPARAQIETLHAASVDNADLAIAAAVPTQLFNGRITITLSEAQSVRWVEDDRGPALSFTQGTLVAQVAPMPAGSSFRACSDTLCVRVIGTAFSLSAGSTSEAAHVQVLHGVVAAYHPSSPEVEVALYAGDDFRAPWHGQREHQSVEALAPKSAPQHKASDACERSTQALADDPVAAEPCLRQAGAEQWAALADAYLRAKLPLRAYAAYAKIYRDFPRTPEAETALFSLATLEMERHQLAAADQRFGDYLKRYPDGDLAEQAEWQRSEIAIQEHDFSRAVRALQAFVTRHHDSERAVDGLYLLGSIYDREFDDEKSAGAAYRQLVARPDAAPGLRKKAAQRLQDLGSEE